MKIRTKAPNFALTKELNENTNKSTKFWLKVWQDLALARLVQFGQNFQTSLVLLIPNCTRHRMITYTNWKNFSSETSFLKSPKKITIGRTRFSSRARGGSGREMNKRAQSISICFLIVCLFAEANFTSRVLDYELFNHAFPERALL
jgi:hypothetical protein